MAFMKESNIPIFTFLKAEQVTTEIIREARSFT